MLAPLITERLGRRFPDRLLKRGFAVLVFAVAIRIAVRAFLG
ncbi:hypothetical protein [Cryobacterium sp. CG_9.6]|nr:hypothetical protein [Cryobacterium sp. CG_9.6]MDH6238189.1 putative membrane protein YfcA [Cryobacterium sp. CG_9.6]